jgi:hypothetical protein
MMEIYEEVANAADASADTAGSSKTASGRLKAPDARPLLRTGGHTRD